MDHDQLRDLICTTAIRRRRTASPGALVRGWDIDCSMLLDEPTVTESAAELLCADSIPPNLDAVVGIERAGIPLAVAVAALLAVPHIPSSALGGTAPGRVLIVDDIINSGRTAHRVIRQVHECGGTVLALACLIKYAKHRPALLSTNDIPILAHYELTDLGLRRFGSQRAAQ